MEYGVANAGMGIASGALSVCVCVCVCCTIKSVTFYVVHANVSKRMCFKIVYC